MPELFSLKGRIAVVTGALGLIGKNHCKALCETGANVIVCDLDEIKCKEFALTLSEKSSGVGVDITKKDSILNLKDEIIKKFSKVDILVNNAALNDSFENPRAAKELSMFENYPLELWQNSLDVNVTGMFLCSQIIGTMMAERGSGSIINIASTYGISAPDQSIYKNDTGEQTFYKSASYPVTKGAVI
ncbi:MAG: SDR family NAD(P)-dependent oxidoreductase, partial [Ignavibacteria bacterium]|nr:SDR family NAD(P)-dependent oxidoreductase [Ignavibacteria bacterium]